MPYDNARLRACVFCVALVAIVAGAFARVADLDHKLFWQDEAFSMLRITGHDETSLYGIFDGRLHAANDLLALERLDPKRGFRTTLASLREEPQRGPLFYLAARAWAGAFGDDVVAMRALPALLGIAGIGFAFLLGCRIGGGVLGGAILAALIAVAPIEFHLARQVREYGALADVILASGWLLLRALARTSRARVAWIAYAASVLAGLFVSPLFVAILVAHGTVAIVAARTGSRLALLRWVAATAVACVLAAPWYLTSVAAARSHAGDLGWLGGPYSARSFVVKWVFNIGAVFFDSEFARVRYGLVLIPVLALVGFAFVWSLRRVGDPPARALVLATMSCTALPLVFLDLVRHTHAESVTRYQMATWSGIDLLVAYVLARTLVAPARGVRYAAAAAFAFLVACGTFSAAFDSRYAIWWDDNEHLDERTVAGVVADGPKPALVVATKDGDAAPNALVLARYLPARTAMLLYGDAPGLPRRTAIVTRLATNDAPALPAGYAATYLFVPSASVVGEIARRAGAAGSLRNVSPPLDLTIPDLRAAPDAAGAAAIRAENALWRIDDGRSR
jgi:uncharacterized membrane protein